MQPTEPGFYWATELSTRMIVQIRRMDNGDLAAFACGWECELAIESLTDWSEKLIDPATIGQPAIASTTNDHQFFAPASQLLDS